MFWNLDTAGDAPFVVKGIGFHLLQCDSCNKSRSAIRVHADYDCTVYGGGFSTGSSSRKSSTRGCATWSPVLLGAQKWKQKKKTVRWVCQPPTLLRSVDNSSPLLSFSILNVPERNILASMHVNEEAQVSAGVTRDSTCVGNRTALRLMAIIARRPRTRIYPPTLDIHPRQDRQRRPKHSD